MLGPFKRNSPFDRYPLPLAGIQIVLLITTIFYSFVLVRETASAHIEQYKSQPIFFLNTQGWSKSAENLRHFEREKIKLQRALVYFSHDFINATLNYFWLIPSQSIDNFRAKGAEVVQAIDEYEQLLRETAVDNQFSEIEEQLIFEEVNKLVLRLIDKQSPPHQIFAMQRKGLLLMKLINYDLTAQSDGLNEELILEIKKDLGEFQAILNAFKFGSDTLKIGALLDQKDQNSLSVIDNGFEPIKRSALRKIREKTIFFKLSAAQREKIGGLENLSLVSKQLDSQLNGTFSKLTTSANVLAILMLEILISVTFLIMIIFKEGRYRFYAEEKFEASKSVLEENMAPNPYEEISSIFPEEAQVIFDRLEYLLAKQVDDLLSVSDFDDQLKSFRANLTTLVGFFDFFRLETYKKDVMHIIKILEESEKRESLDSEKLSELIIDIQNILGSVSFKTELAEFGQ